MLIRLIAAMLPLGGSALLAQSPSASVVGRVTDSAGGVVPTVRVTLTNLDTSKFPTA